MRGNVVINTARQTADSRSGVVISGDFQCTDIRACAANFGEVAGNAGQQQSLVHRVEYQPIFDWRVPAVPAKTSCADACVGPDRVAGASQDQCARARASAAGVGAAVQRARYDPAFGMAGNPMIASATSTLVAATPTNAAFCNVQVTYSAIAKPWLRARQAQAIRIGIRLPINNRLGAWRRAVHGTERSKTSEEADLSAASAPRPALPVMVTLAHRPMAATLLRRTERAAHSASFKQRINSIAERSSITSSKAFTSRSSGPSSSR